MVEMSVKGRVLGTLLLICSMGLLPPYADPEEERWRLAGKSRTDTLWYIDTESISYPSKDVVSVWVRTVPDTTAAGYVEGTESTDDILKNIQGKYFGDYKYTEGLWELDCARSMFRLLYFSVYSKENKIITSPLTPDADWSYIIQGSVGETIQEAVCKR
ncbi:MAG TPA: surface-adhesin E family protein [Thermodesulfovibrionales bacterium]|nr:surface-adhesin E family protein [Thermodesulfovibrionales bacterium]